MLASAVVVLLSGAQTAPVTLLRKFKKGQTYSYAFKSHLFSDTAQTGQPLGTPEETDFLYNFTAKIDDVLPSGFASVTYSRPTVTIIDGERFDSPPVTHDEKVDLNATLQLSPINEITDVKEISAKPKPKSPTRKHGGMYFFGRLVPTAQVNRLPFLSDLQRMALMYGSPVDGLDFSPKLPLEAVKVGDTWKRTVSYQPQDLSGNKKGKQAMQRVDLVYKYEGQTISNGRKVELISSKVDLDTDATKFIADSMGVKMEKSPVKSLHVVIHSSFRYDLDPDDFHTISIKGKTNGSYTFVVESEGQTGEVVQTIKAETSLTQK